MKNKIIAVLFFICLALPNLIFPVVRDHIDSANHENRTYASFPDISAEGIFAFPQKFEDYYYDHLPFKNQMKRLDSKISGFFARYESPYTIQKGMQTALPGAENWLFYLSSDEGENTLDDYCGTNLYTQEELERIADMYRRADSWFKERGQELVLFIPPSKEQIYGEYMPEKIERAAGDTRTDQAVAYLRANTELTVVYPKEALLSCKDMYPLYYKYDTHWNDLGAFVGVQQIDLALQGNAQSLGDMAIVEDGSHTGDLAELLGMAKDYQDDTEYRIEGYQADVYVEIAEEEPDGAYYHFVSEAEDKRSMLVLRDSFGVAMLDYLSRDYRDVKFVTGRERAKEILEKEKPDILLLEMVERSADRFEAEAGELAGFTD